MGLPGRFLGSVITWLFDALRCPGFAPDGAEIAVLTLAHASDTGGLWRRLLLLPHVCT